jgi:hypothetical protein
LARVVPGTGLTAAGRFLVADQPVEESRLAYVGRADDGHVVAVAESHLRLFLGRAEQLAHLARLARQHRQQRQ